MSAPVVKGWCPGALRPMASGDGLIVRIRPPRGMLASAQAAGIARAARAHGSGIIDLSSRANLQLRGVREDAHAALIHDLGALGLIDPDIETETLRNLVVTPFRDPETDALAARLTAALADAPRLPAKFGFALDTGERRVLQDASADIRIERAADGRIIVRPDGHDLGRHARDPVAEALAMANWFLAAGGAPEGRGRMAALVARGDVPDGCTVAPAPGLARPGPGACSQGCLIGFAFGQMQAETLLDLAALDREIRLTPWRMLLVVGLNAIADVPGVITRQDDPLLRVVACTGAPGCPQALGDTRALGRRLAPLVPKGALLHVSGCGKGCAHPGPTRLAIVATARGYDLIRNGTASSAATVSNLTADHVSEALKDTYAASL